MSTKPAKIGIFFSDKPAAHDKPVAKPRTEIKECRPEPKSSAPKQPQQTQPAKPQTPRAEQSSTETRNEQPRSNQPKQPQQRAQQTQPVSANTSSDEQSAAEKPRRIPAAWNDAMINTTQTWLKKTLNLMGMNTIEFSSVVAGKNLKLTFNTPLIADPMHEKQLFRSFAHLIMSSLRNQYKQEIKDLKVILIRPE